MPWVKIAAGFMFLAVALGAFGAHALRDKLSGYSLEIYKTAVLYHMAHALGLFAVAWLSKLGAPKADFAGILMAFGIIIFSGSLYVLSITGIKWIGAITPIGGLCFLAAWLMIILTKF